MDIGEQKDIIRIYFRIFFIIGTRVEDITNLTFGSNDARGERLTPKTKKEGDYLATMKRIGEEVRAVDLAQRSLALTSPEPQWR